MTEDYKVFKDSLKQYKDYTFLFTSVDGYCVKVHDSGPIGSYIALGAKPVVTSETEGAQVATVYVNGSDNHPISRKILDIDFDTSEVTVQDIVDGKYVTYNKKVVVKRFELNLDQPTIIELEVDG